MINNNHKKTVTSERIKKEIKRMGISRKEAAQMAGIGYYDLENIIAGKSNKINKIEAIAKMLDKPVAYFIPANQNSSKERYKKWMGGISYDSELHSKIVSIIGDVCKKNKISLNKMKMDELVDFVYPRFHKTKNIDELASIQTEAILGYIMRN